MKRVASRTLIGFAILLSILLGSGGAFEFGEGVQMDPVPDIRLSQGVSSGSATAWGRPLGDKSAAAIPAGVDSHVVLADSRVIGKFYLFYHASALARRAPPGTLAMSATANSEVSMTVSDKNYGNLHVGASGYAAAILRIEKHPDFVSQLLGIDTVNIQIRIPFTLQTAGEPGESMSGVQFIITPKGSWPPVPPGIASVLLRRDEDEVWIPDQGNNTAGYIDHTDSDALLRAPLTIGKDYWVYLRAHATCSVSVSGFPGQEKPSGGGSANAFIDPEFEIDPKFPHPEGIRLLISPNAASDEPVSGPRASLVTTQGGKATRLVTTDGGTVTVTATVDSGEDFVFDWGATDDALGDTDGKPSSDEFTFSPSGLAPGVYLVGVAVISKEKGCTWHRQLLRVVATEPALAAGADSDGDGEDDATEGYGDANGSGIPAYLDRCPERHCLPTTPDDFHHAVLTTSSGRTLRIGTTAFAADRRGARVTTEDLEAHGGRNGTTGYRTTDSHAHVGGMFDLQISDLADPGDTVDVVIPLSAPLPAGAVLRRFTTGRGWADFASGAFDMIRSAPGPLGTAPPPGDAAWQDGLTEGHTALRVTIRDGGLNDADRKADGSLQFLGGVGSLAPLARLGSLKGVVDAACPDPEEAADKKSGKAAKKIAKGDSKADKYLAKAAVATKEKRVRKFGRKAHKKLQRLLDSARRYESKGRLGVSLPQLEAAVEELMAEIEAEFL